MQNITGYINNLNLRQFAIITFIVGLVLYGNTLGHSYALDDAIVITKNEFTKQGIKGIPDILKYDSFTGFFGKEKQLVNGGRYRPLSLITFAVEYLFFGEWPMLSHMVNILIYCLVVILFYGVVVKLLKPKLNSNQAMQIAFFGAILFLVHPLHTEVVANIKGRDELLSLLFSLLALRFSLLYIQKGKTLHLLMCGVIFFMGLMSKENTIAFVVLIPLAIWFFMDFSAGQIAKITVVLVVSALVFLTIRYNVLGGFQQRVAGELMNNPFLGVPVSQKLATILYTWAVYLKLLVFPHPLTYDYYPYHIPIVGFSDATVIFSLTLVLMLLFVAAFQFKRRTVISFSIIGFAATFSMVSNLVFPVGTFMNERFVFMPSLFWCLALSLIGVRLFYFKKKWAKPVLALAGLYFLSFYPAKTIARNRVWKNDLTLFTTDVKVSKNSAKSNCSAGGKLWEEAKKNTDSKKKNDLFAQSEVYLRRALKIYPQYVDAWILLGNELYDSEKDIEQSVRCFIEVIKLQPGNDIAWRNSDIVLQKSNNRKQQLLLYKQLYKLDSNRYIENYRLGIIYGRYFNNLDKSIYYLQRAHKINPQKVEALKDLGTAYGISGMEQKAYDACKMALKLDDNDAQIYINLGIAATKLGHDAEAKQYFLRAERIKAKTQP